MRFYWLVLGIAATWRITHLLYAEDGPSEVLVRLRRVAGSSPVGTAMDCFYCLSIWTSAPLAFVVGNAWKDRLLLWPALSCGAIALELLISRSGAPPVVVFDEKGDEPDVVLREGTSAAAVGDDSQSEQP